MSVQPKGFWSYARLDDAHLDGVLTRLRERLAGEVSAVLGADVDIFQDIFDLRTGDKWAEKLKSELTEASFLIPVLTPRYFTREWCREETLTFLRLAKERGVEPLIFPIRFIEFDPDPACEVRSALEPFQFKDFSQWRFQSDPTVRARTEYEYARDIKDSIRDPGPVPTTKSGKVVAAQRKAEKQDSGSTPSTNRKKLPELVVDQWPKRGDFTTISDAIEAAEPGSRIIVRPGTYEEALVVDKPLELIGEGGDGSVLVKTTNSDTMVVSASLALVQNFSLLRDTEDGADVALWVKAGRAVFEDCRFISKSLSAVEVK